VSEIPRILKRAEGRTIYTRGGRVMVRFDSDEAREKFEVSCRFSAAVGHLDFKAAADVVFDALNKGLIDDPDDLIGGISERGARQIYQQLNPMIEAAVERIAGAISEEWPDGPRLVE
jgi:hypothetical protein